MDTTVFAATSSSDDADALPTASARPARRSVLSAEVLVGPPAFSALRSDWDRLAVGEASCFQAPDMLHVWSGHFARRPGKLQTVVVRHSGRAVLVWPLAVSRRLPVRIVGGAGAPIAQYDDMLLDPDAHRRDVLAAAMDCIRCSIRPDILLFGNIRPDSPILDALGPAAVPLCPTEGAPYTDLAGGVAAVRAGMKTTRARQNQRKRVEKLESAGAGSFQIAETPAEAEAWLDEILAAKRQWLTATGRFSRAFNDPRTAACLRDMARTLISTQASARVVISRLSLDGTMAAMEFAFVHRGTYYLYIGAFSEELARFGPGNVLTEKAMEWCVAKGIRRYDMMAPRTRNKAEWQSGEVELTDRVLPLTRRGKVYTETMLRIGPAVRERFYRLPDGWRSAITARLLRI